MTEPVLIWRGKAVTDMSREELIQSINQVCGLMQVQKDSVSQALQSIRGVSDKRARLARADGIFIGLILGGIFGVAVGVLSASAFFLLT